MKAPTVLQIAVLIMLCMNILIVAVNDPVIKLHDVYFHQRSRDRKQHGVCLIATIFSLKRKKTPFLYSVHYSSTLILIVIDYIQINSSSFGKTLLL